MHHHLINWIWIGVCCLKLKNLFTYEFRSAPLADFKIFDLLRAQDILDSCNRELEEIKFQVLKTSGKYINSKISPKHICLTVCSVLFLNCHHYLVFVSKALR